MPVLPPLRLRGRTMNASEDRQARYRKRAAAARRKADRLPDCETREVMLEVAATWERLADLETKTPPLSSAKTP